MQENEFSSRGDVIADDGSVDVSSETSNGSRDTNMESDVFRRGRWRRPLSELLDLHQVLFSTEGIISTRLWIYVYFEEVDIYHVVGRPSLVVGLSLLGSLEDNWWISPCPIFCRHFTGHRSRLFPSSVLRLDVRFGLRHYIPNTSTFGGDKLTAINNILRIIDPSEFGTLVTPSGINTNIYPSMDTRPIDVIFCLRQHDISALLMTLFWKVDIQFLDTSSINRQHINVVIFGEHRHLTDHLLDGTRDFQVVDWRVICFGYDGLFLLHYLLQLWGVMVISCAGGFTLFYGLLQCWAQHVHHLMTKIHVAWGDFLHSTLGLLKRMETSACCASLFDVLSSDIITHKFQEIGHRIILVLGHHYNNSDHTSNKILFITITRSVLELLVRYYPSYIQGYAFVGIVCGMVSSVSTALELLQYHKMMIREYCPVKMRYFINLELLLSCEMNGEQGSFEMNGEQIPSIEYPSVTIHRCHYPVRMRDFIISELIWYFKSNGIQFYKTKKGEQVLLCKLIEAQEDSTFGSQVVIQSYHHQAQQLDTECKTFVPTSLQDFAAQFYLHDSQDIADGFCIVIAWLHLHHLSFVEITEDHRQRHFLLHNNITNHVLMDRHHPVMIITEEYGERLLLRNTAEEYGETSSSTRLHHIIRPSGDTSFCESESYSMLALLGIAAREDTNRAQFGDENFAAIFSAQVGYDIILKEFCAILVSIGSDTRHMMIARFASRIDCGKPNIYVLRNQVNSVLQPDIVSYERHRLGLNHGERMERVAIQALIDASRNSAYYHEIIVIGCSITTRSNRLFDGFLLFIDIFARSAVQEIFFVRTPDKYDQLQLHDKLQHQVADDCIYLEVQVTNGNRPFSQVTNSNRPFANNHNALSSTFSKVDLRLPSPKEEELLSLSSPKEGELLIQHPSPTGKINDYQELLEMPMIMETTSHNNKFTAQMFFEIVDYLLKWGAWNTTFGWLGSVELCKKAYERNRICTSMSSMVHYLWILKILISRLMGIVPFIYRKLNVESSAIVGSAELIFPPYLYTRY